MSNAILTSWTSFVDLPSVGIVTKFTIETHSISTIWGGARYYVGEELINAAIAAVHNFVGENDDPRAALISSSLNFAPGGPLGPEALLLQLFYDGE